MEYELRLCPACGHAPHEAESWCGGLVSGRYCECRSAAPRFQQEGDVFLSGCGCPHIETLCRAFDAVRWEGDVLVRVPVRVFRYIQTEGHYGLPIVAKGGRRVIDLSDLLPSAFCHAYVSADNRVPEGCGLLYGEPKEQLLIKIAF